jgi:hypothetical protein
VASAATDAGRSVVAQFILLRSSRDCLELMRIPGPFRVANASTGSAPNDRENLCRQAEAATFSCVPGPGEATLTHAASVPIEPHRGPVVGLHLRKRKIMSNEKPILIAYTAKGREGQKAIGTRIGAAWPHKGPGLTIQLDALPIGDRIVLREPKADGVEGQVTFRGRPRGRPLFHLHHQRDFSHDDLHSPLSLRRDFASQYYAKRAG